MHLRLSLRRPSSVFCSILSACESLPSAWTILVSNFFKNADFLTANYPDFVSVVCIPLPVGINRVSCSVRAPSRSHLPLPASDLSPPEFAGSGVPNTFWLTAFSASGGFTVTRSCHSGGPTPCLSSWKCPADSTVFPFWVLSLSSCSRALPFHQP